MSSSANHFLFCPSCKSSRIKMIECKHWVCQDCGFDLFHNVASAVGLIITVKNKVLMTVRSYEPKKGLLCFPGGFVNPYETLEQACFRECQEEIGIIVPTFSYFASFPNQYEYKDFLYHTSDTFFLCDYDGHEADLFSAIKLLDGEVAECILVDPAQLDERKIAFDSGVQVIRRLKNI
ncbi:MAG: NUDIX hydrolase [Treponemataceae bacterium]